MLLQNSAVVCNLFYLILGNDFFFLLLTQKTYLCMLYLLSPIYMKMKHLVRYLLVQRGETISRRKLSCNRCGKPESAIHVGSVITSANQRLMQSRFNCEDEIFKSRSLLARAARFTFNTHFSFLSSLTHIM